MLGSGASNEIFSNFASFFCAAGSQVRVHENTSRVSGCLRLPSGVPDAVASAREVQTVSWGLFFVVVSSCVFRVSTTATPQA